MGDSEPGPAEGLDRDGAAPDGTADGADPDAPSESAFLHARVGPEGARAAAAVARAASVVARELDRSRVARAIVDQAVAALGAREAHLHLIDEGVLRLAAWRNLPAEAVARLGVLDLDAPFLAARAARTRALQVVGGPDDLAPDLGAAREILLATGSTGMVAAPLIAFGKLHGTITCTRVEADGFTSDEVGAIRAICEVFAVGLANARAYESAGQQRRQLEALRRATLAISEAPGLDAVLQTIVDQARLVATAEYAALGIVARESEPFTPWVFSGLGPDVERLIGRHPRPVGLLGAVPAEGKVLRIRDMARDPRFRGFPPGHPEMRSFLGVPILHGGRSVGNLYLANKVGGGSFTDGDEHAIELLAKHAAIAVAQARDRETVIRESEERRLAVEALRRSEESLARAQVIAHLGSFDWDLRTGATFWSAELYRILGVAPGSLEPSVDRFLAMVAARDRPRVRALVEDRVKDGGDLSYETRLVRADGTERLIRTAGQLVRDEEGRPVRMVGTVQDVTERVRAEEERARLLALAAERSWLRTVIERSPVGILLLGEAGVPVAVNRRAEQLFGGAITDPARRPGPVLRADRTPLAFDELPSARAARGETINAEELILVHPDGSEVPVLASAAPILVPGGAVGGAVLVLEDITPLKELARMREEWTSVVAHDLRQPVTTIRAYAGLLARHGDAGVRARAEHVQGAARRLDRMIADLLDVSRIEAHRLVLDFRPVELEPLLRSLGERAAVEYGGHRVEVTVEADLPPVRADPERLEQVLANLVSNAFKYGDPEAPVAVRATRHGEEAEVAVENRGPGIAPEDLPRLFQRFNRGRRPGRVPGIGLGLYIARGIVEAHGGRIAADSVPGDLTTFRFTVPFASLH